MLKVSLPRLTDAERGKCKVQHDEGSEILQGVNRGEKECKCRVSAGVNRKIKVYAPRRFRAA